MQFDHISLQSPLSCKESQEKRQDRKDKACRPTGYHKLLTSSGFEQRRVGVGRFPLLREGVNSSRNHGHRWAVADKFRDGPNTEWLLGPLSRVLPTNGMFSSGGNGSVPVGVSRPAHPEFSVFSVKRNVLLQAGQRHPSTEPPVCVQSLAPRITDACEMSMLT